MKRIGIHQINYFPWTGYFNKMAKSDVFVYLDEVQLSDRGYSQRTPVISSEGKQSYLTVSVDKKGHREKKFSEICIHSSAGWQEKQRNFLKGNYAAHPYYEETMSLIDPVLSGRYQTLMEVTLLSIEMIREVLGIRTQTVMQSALDYDSAAKKNDLMLALTKSCGGDVYLSGNGARSYMDLKEFEKEHVRVQYLKFDPFQYKQNKTDIFIPGLSILDMLFNLGMEQSKELFWNNLQEYEVFDLN